MRLNRTTRHFHCVALNGEEPPAEIGDTHVMELLNDAETAVIQLFCSRQFVCPRVRTANPAAFHMHLCLNHELNGSPE